jgi:MFS family permease
MAYSVGLFISSGLSEDEAKYANIGIGGLILIMTLVGMPLLDRLGRKPLHLFGLAGMLLTSIVYTISAHYTSPVMFVFKSFTMLHDLYSQYIINNADVIFLFPSVI